MLRTMPRTPSVAVRMEIEGSREDVETFLLRAPTTNFVENITVALDIHLGLSQESPRMVWFKPISLDGEYLTTTRPAPEDEGQSTALLASIIVFSVGLCGVLSLLMRSLAKWLWKCVDPLGTVARLEKAAAEEKRWRKKYADVMAALEWKPPPGFNGGAGSGMLAQEGLTAEMRRKQIKNLREMQIQGKRRALVASYHELHFVIQRNWRDENPVSWLKQIRHQDGAARVAW